MQTNLWMLKSRGVVDNSLCVGHYEQHLLQLTQSISSLPPLFIWCLLDQQQTGGRVGRPMAPSNQILVILFITVDPLMGKCFVFH